MFATGASYAHVHVLQKNEKGKLKSKEELEIRAKKKAPFCMVEKLFGDDCRPRPGTKKKIHPATSFVQEPGSN